MDKDNKVVNILAAKARRANLSVKESLATAQIYVYEPEITGVSYVARIKGEWFYIAEAMDCTEKEKQRRVGENIIKECIKTIQSRSPNTPIGKNVLMTLADGAAKYLMASLKERVCITDSATHLCFVVLVYKKSSIEPRSIRTAMVKSKIRCPNESELKKICAQLVAKDKRNFPDLFKTALILKLVPCDEHSKKT